MTFYDKTNNPQQPTRIIPGYYTLEILASTLENMLKKEFDVKIPAQINQPNGLMIIYNTTGHRITLDADLAKLCGVGRDLGTVNYVKRLNATKHLLYSL